MAANGRATRLLDDRLRGKDPSAALRVNSGGGDVSVGSVHGYRIRVRCGSGEGEDGRGRSALDGVLSQAYVPPLILSMSKEMSGDWLPLSDCNAIML